MNVKELEAKVKEWNKTKSIKLASDICRELAESMGIEDGRN